MGISNNASGLRPGVCTSTTRPTAPYTGQVIYETDTLQTLVWNGTAWAYIGFTGTTNLAMGGSGHSNIYSRNTVNSNRPSTAIVQSAVRLVQGRFYFFNNLTFNMPSNVNTDTSDWTAPGTDVYKWSYVFIRPSDNKFYLSNTAPSAGQNYKTIGGSMVIYLFPIYSDSTVMHRFDLANSLYSLLDVATSQTYNTYVAGINLVSQTNLAVGAYTGGTSANATSKFPTTATLLNTRFNYSVNGRYDSGGVVNVLFEPIIRDEAGTDRVIHTLSAYHYFKTPTDSGAYFPVYNWEISLDNLSTRRYNFSVIRANWSIARGYADAYNAYWWNLHSFVDGSIF